jgi:hypothetical protein
MIGVKGVIDVLEWHTRLSGTLACEIRYSPEM